MSRKPFSKTVTGRVVAVERHGHTIYGNPMMSVTLAVQAIDGIPAESSTPATLRISNDAMIVYGIENPEYREHPHVFDLTPSGRVSGRVRCTESCERQA